jgi:hypothetical protein
MNFLIVPAFPQSLDTFRSGASIANDNNVLFPDMQINHYHPRNALYTYIRETFYAIVQIWVVTL